MGRNQHSRTRDAVAAGGPSGRHYWLLPLALLALGFLLWPEGEASSPTPAPEASAAQQAAIDEKTKPTPTAEAPKTSSAEVAVERFKVKQIASYPHDTGAYTQGLLWYDGALYESTGLNGRSTLRRVDLDSGTVEQTFSLSSEYFAEGLARVDDRLVQITWKKGTAFVYDAATLQNVETAHYSGEGWGLCHAEGLLYMTDGTALLSVRDASDFSRVDERTITLRGRPQPAVNELECVDGQIYGNVFGSEAIVRIDPATARVTAIIDASGLLPAAERQGVDVMNGIAYHPERRTFFLTGKLWPMLYEVTFVRQD